MSSPIALQELFKAGFEDFVIPSYETAPFTTIQNRAKVTRSLKAIAGIERVHVKGLNRLENEFGPNGEQVFEAENKDSRVRFVGSGWVISANNSGSIPFTATVNDFVEITFYGTGLNLGTYLDITTRDYRATVDNGVEGSNLQLATASGILAARNYNACQIIPVVSGLILGWHTVKIRTAATGLVASCFEILNQRTDLAVYAGAGISNGSFNGLSSLATSAFNQGVTGTRGARVVKYIENGSLKSVVQEVDSAAKYLTLADHTNEEIVRRINFREFGANRADDYSTLSTTSNRAFTLDDGTTTLVGQNNTTSTGVLTGATNLMVPAGVTNFIAITFVGTGLDITRENQDANARSETVFVDGVSVGTIGLAANEYKVLKLCSGLPYGTHTVRIVNNSSTLNGCHLQDFIIYQPKKPSISAGALEVADYNLMGNTSLSSIAGGEVLSIGVINKTPMREVAYVGAAWTFDAVTPTVSNGFYTRTSVTGNYFEYTFYGTGVEISGYGQISTISQTIQINGVAYTGAATAVGASSTWTPGTSTWVLGTTVGSRLQISGLTLGLHKIRVTHVTNAQNFYLTGVHVITPIHINNPTLKVGSQSLKSVTKYSPEKSVSNAGPDLSKAKAWIVFDGANQLIEKSYNISAFLRNTTGQYTVYFEKPFKNEFYTCSYQGATSQGIISLAGTPDAGNPEGKKSNRFTFTTTNTTGGRSEAPTNTSLVFFGELIDE